MRYLPTICAMMLLPAVLPAQVREVKLTRFTMQSSAVIAAGGDSLSSVHYSGKNYWFPVTVPCTVLTGLVANKVYPDPYIGMNNMLIPDANDSFNKQYHLEQYSYLPGEPNPWKKPYWYRTMFVVPATDRGKHFQLIFKGINYRAEVWLNGTRLADSARMVGMFEEFDLDASAAIHAGGANALAVKIYPLDFPGLPSHPQTQALGDFFENGGPTGDIGKNVTMLCSAGWDWIPEVHDRNIGIWQPVYLRTTGQVTISKPHIVTELPGLPDTTVAKISLAMELRNYDAGASHGTVTVTITPENFSGQQAITLSKNVAVGPNGSADLNLNAADFPALTVRHPRLWWPNGYGEPNLYRVRIRYSDGAGVSDDTSVVFGIRTVSSSAVTVGGFTRRDFYVNGHRVHLVGGAWVPDMMLNRDRLRYDYELRLCRNANVNMVRVWGGGLGETDDFYELADRYGLLVWQDFWITGDTNGGFKGSSDWPLESRVFIDNVVSTIYRVRNHPSLLVWTGGNEGHARKELYDAMRDNVATLDGTRPFIPCSSGFSHAPKDWKGSWPDDKPAGVYSGGPYSWQDGTEYYRLVDRQRDWVFKDETGIPSQPPYNTLARIVPNLVPDNSLPYPLNNTWGYHDACTGNGHYDTYYKAMLDRYGAPTSMRDFSEKMQLLNANGYRSIFEAAGHKLRETGGVMLWKLNAAFPSVVWQVYDWYLEPNSGYYFMKRACEKVHIQLNLDDSAIAITNRSYSRMRDLRYDVQVVSMTGRPLFKQQGTVSVDSTDSKEILSVRDVLNRSTVVTFVILTLRDAQGKTVSDNVYWISPGHDFADLRAMPAASVRPRVVGRGTRGDYTEWTLEFSNPSPVLAFFLNPQVVKDGQEVLPSYWSDNYFSIAAGGSCRVTVSCPTAMLRGGPARLKLEGWNIAASETGLGQ